MPVNTGTLARRIRGLGAGLVGVARLGCADGAAGVVESASELPSGLAIAATTSTAAQAVTIHFVRFEVPVRSQSPTRPTGRQSTSPGTIAHQVCHHALSRRVPTEAGDGAPAHALV